MKKNQSVFKKAKKKDAILKKKYRKNIFIPRVNKKKRMLDALKIIRIIINMKRVSKEKLKPINILLNALEKYIQQPQKLIINK